MKTDHILNHRDKTDVKSANQVLLLKQQWKGNLPILRFCC